LTNVLLAGFGTDGLCREEAMKTTDRENPKRWATTPANRANGATGQNRSCSFKGAAKEEKLQPQGRFFLLTSTFIELTGTWAKCRRLYQTVWVALGIQSRAADSAMDAALQENRNAVEAIFSHIHSPGLGSTTKSS